VHDLVSERGYETEIVPGVTSFCAAAARLGMPLCAGSERLTVLPASDVALDEALDEPGTKVLMKAGRSLGSLRSALAERGELDHASMVANCGLVDEQVFPRFADGDVDVGYFSIVIVKDSNPGYGGNRADA
jgi:precorrin-2/cobalt-factor-2 C20-methyltransferase